MTVISLDDGYIPLKNTYDIKVKNKKVNYCSILSLLCLFLLCIGMVYMFFWSYKSKQDAECLFNVENNMSYGVCDFHNDTLTDYNLPYDICHPWPKCYLNMYRSQKDNIYKSYYELSKINTIIFQALRCIFIIMIFTAIFAIL